MKTLLLSLLLSAVYAAHAPEDPPHPAAAPIDKRVQATLDEILAQFPDLKRELPVELEVKDTTDISDDVLEIVTGDLARPDALRFKLLRRLLGKSASGEEARRQAALAARVYAISKAKVPKNSLYYVPAGLHFTPANVAEYTANYREAKRYEKDSKETFEEKVNEARLHAIAWYFYRLHQEPSWRGRDDVLLSLLADYAEASQDPSVWEKWAKVLVSGKRPSTKDWLAGFEAELPEKARTHFAKLRAAYHLSDEAVDALDKQIATLPVPKANTPLPTEMPTLNGWTMAPEHVAQLATKRHTYEVDRKFPEYVETLPPDFIELLAAKGAAARWLDGGCGEGYALEEYLTQRGSPMLRNMPESAKHGETSETNRRRENAWKKLLEIEPEKRGRAIGVTVELKRKAPDRGGRLRIIPNYLENVPEKTIGPVDVVTDVFGALSYANQADEVMNIYLRQLAPQGKAFLHIGNGKIWVKTKSGQELPFRDWLSTQPGLVVDKIGELDKRFVVSKTTEGARVGKLRLVYATGDSPPKRVYVED